MYDSLLLSDTLHTFKEALLLDCAAGIDPMMRGDRLNDESALSACTGVALSMAGVDADVV